LADRRASRQGIAAISHVVAVKDSREPVADLQLMQSMQSSQNNTNITTRQFIRRHDEVGVNIGAPNEVKTCSSCQCLLSVTAAYQEHVGLEMALE